MINTTQIVLFEFLVKLSFVFTDELVLTFLFGGAVQPFHKTKFAVETFVSRYAEGIHSLNRAVILSVGFVPIALLTSGDPITIPFIDLAVTRQNWLRVCPAISYGLQVFTLVSLCWFLLLRRGLEVLQKELGAVDHFGEVANLMLTGVLGSLWLVMSVRRHFPSRWHLIWFVPVGLLLFLIVLSPTMLCGYFVFELYAISDWVPAIAYSVLLIPSAALALALIGVSAIGSIKEVFAKRLHADLSALATSPLLRNKHRGMSEPPSTTG
jgi:hypothetical protein